MKCALYPLLIGFFLFSGTGRISAQQALALRECVALALEHNLQHLSNYQSLAQSLAQLQSARAPFAFRMDAAFTAPSFTELRDVQENVALQTRIREENTDFRYAGNLRLSQRLPYLGEFTVTSNAFRRDFSSNRRADFLDISGDLGLEYTHQVLTTPGQEISLRRAEHSFSSARLNYRRQELLLEGQVIEDYYALVQSIRQLEIEEQRLQQSRASLELAQRKFEVGLIAEVEALRLQVAMLQAEASHAQAKTAIERRRDLLRQTLGLELDAPLEIVTAVDYQPQPVSPARALEIGLRRRTDLRQAEILEEIRALDLEDAQNRNGMSATLNAEVSLQGKGDEIGDISHNLERNRWGVGLQINLPLIDNGQRRSELSQARIALEQSRLSRQRQHRQIVQEIREAVRNLKEAERQIQLRQATLEVAERTYQVEQSRFELGLAQSQDLLIAQGELTGARIDALTAIIDYQRQLKNVRLATMADLEQLADSASD